MKYRLMMKSKLLLAIAMIFAAMSCDVIDKPFVENPNNGGGGGGEQPEGVARKILIEEFTGVNCQNCPTGAAKLHELIELYPGKIVPVAVHAGYFARPKKGQYDFQTEIGTAWDKFFGNSEAGTPNALINRFSLNKKNIFAPNEWVEVIGQMLNKEADFKIEITSNLNAESKVITAEIKVETMKNIEKKHNLTVVLVQDKIVDKQNVGGTIKDDYEHNHALRAGFNGTWGEEIIASPVAKGTKIDKKYTLNVKEDEKHPWATPNLKVVAFITDPETQEVMQVEEVVVK